MTRRVWEGIAAYGDARAEHRRIVEDANATLKAHRAHLERELTDLLAVSQDEQRPVDLTWIKRLYWETDVPATLLATMLGLKHGSQVYEFVGDYATEQSCIVCGSAYLRTATSRTDALTWWRRICDDCEAQEKKNRAARANQRVLVRHETEEDRVDRERRQAALDGGHLSRVYVEFPGDGHTYEVKGGRIIDGTLQS